MDLYQHVIIEWFYRLVGFSLTRLLNGASQLIQHQRKRIYWVHLVWVLFMFLYVIAFWLWEFGLASIPAWTFPLYVFVIIYGILVYLLCALLFPINWHTTNSRSTSFTQKMVLWGDGSNVGSRFF
jgi:hypothetical protein